MALLVQFVGVQLCAAQGAVLCREPWHGHQGAHSSIQQRRGKCSLVSISLLALSHEWKDRPSTSA
jgi:hypothetical protein